jgi:hypothetical protein
VCHFIRKEKKTKGRLEPAQVPKEKQKTYTHTHTHTHTPHQQVADTLTNKKRKNANVTFM